MQAFTCHVKRVMADSARSLMVGEENVAAALALLGEAEQADQVDLEKPVSKPCSAAANRRTHRTLPAYAGLTFVAGVATVLGAFLIGRGDAFLPLWARRSSSVRWST